MQGGVYLFNIIENLSKTSLLAEKDGIKYVLKMMLPEERAIYETISDIRNENLAGVFGTLLLDGVNYAVVEYVEGLSVEEHILKYGKPDNAFIKRIIIEVCNGLSALHKNNIVHRDITPANVIIDINGNAKIIDYGISRITDFDKTKDTQVLGTVGYAAPEQFGFTQTTAKADIYAVGVLINYLAEGALPNEKLTEGPFKKTVLKCTQMEQNKRYNSVEEIESAMSKSLKIKNFFNSIPGFSGPKPLKFIAAFFYISVVFSSVSPFFMSDVVHPFEYVFTFIFFLIAPIFIIADKKKRIKKFCAARHWSSKAVILIKAAAIYFSALFGAFIILIFETL